MLVSQSLTEFFPVLWESQLPSTLSFEGICLALHKDSEMAGFLPCYLIVGAVFSWLHHHLQSSWLNSERVNWVCPYRFFLNFSSSEYHSVYLIFIIIYLFESQVDTERQTKHVHVHAQAHTCRDRKRGISHLCSLPKCPQWLCISVFIVLYFSIVPVLYFKILFYLFFFLLLPVKCFLYIVIMKVPSHAVHNTYG